MSPRPTPTSRPAAVAAAFTLVEMATVVTLVGIVAALAVPMMSDTAALRAAAAQRKLAGDLMYAQGLAVARRQSIYVRCQADRYDVCTLAGGTLTAVAHPFNPGAYVVRFGASATERALARVSFPLPSFAVGSNRVLGFDPTGVPFAYNESTGTRTSLASRAQLAVVASGVQRLVYVEAFTGELRVP